MLKHFLSLSFVLLNLLISQDRSVLYNNGNPIGIATGNFVYNNDTMDVRFSNRVSIPEDYVLERIAFYLGFSEYPDSLFLNVQLDSLGLPGESIDEWEIIINPNYANGGSYQVPMLSECIHLDAGTNIWITLLSKGSGIAKWFHTDEIGWPYTRTQDGGNSWSDIMTTDIGANIVYAEQIYYQEPLWGDLNSDLIVNIVDIIEIVQNIIGNNEFNDNQLYIGDTNQDGEINIVDIINIINIILEITEPMPIWLLEDININSESFTELIGPEIYQGNISCYYFGKAG